MKVTLAATNFVVTFAALVQAPSLEQSPRACVRGRGEEARQVVGRVDIERDARQLEHRWLDPAALGGGEMGKEAVGAEAQWHGVGRRAEDGIGAALVVRRHDDEGASAAT